MILDENLFEIKEARGSKEGVKRGPYNKEKSKSKEDLYDELQDRLEKEFYFPGVAKGGNLKVNLIMKDENKAELKGKKPARLIASSMSKYRDVKDEKELDTAKKIAKEMGFKTELDKTKRVPTLIIKLEESLNEKKSNRLTYHEFVDYLDSIDNGYTGFAKVTGNKGSGYRYTLSNKLTREQHDYLAQYDNVDFGTAQYRYAPEIKYDTVILLDRMSKTSPMKEDYDEDFFYTYEAIRHGESAPNRKYSGDFEDEDEAVELAKDDGYDEVVRYTYDFISDNFDDYWGMPPRRTDTIWTKESGYLNEGIVKTSKGKWVNKGKEGTHGEFLTKKKAREQQKAMFASGWKGESLEESADRVSIEHDFEDITNMSDAKERLKKYGINLIKKDNRNYVLRKDGKGYTFYVLDNPNEVRKDLVKAVYKLTSGNSAIKENIGSDIAEYQKWIDYDMKKYGRISSLTNHKVRKAGLKIVKDKYGDYEVIANEPIREDLEREFTIHYNREGFEFGGYGAVRVKATNEDEAKEKFYAEKKDDKIIISSIRPTENEDIRKGIRLLEDKGFDEIEEIGESKFGTKEYKYKKYTIEHFPIDAHIDGMEPQHIESYIIKSPAVLTNSGYHLPLYCEDEKGNEVNFRSLQQVKDWIDKFDGKFKLQWKYGDELHAVINDESLEESLKNNEVADFFDKAKKLGVKTLKDLKILLAQPEAKGESEKEKLDNYSKEANPEDKDLTEDVQVVDKNQAEIDKKVGLENLLNDLINDENEAINGYNSAIVNFELEGKSDLTDVFRDIIKDEQNHIGNLQKVLNEINPTTIANLEQGQQEAADTLNK